MSKLTVEELPYHSEMIHHYQALSDLPGFVLLESTDNHRGCFDIITALPYDRLTVQRDSADIADVYTLIQQRLAPTTSSYGFPFQGGAIGFFSYDFGALLAGIDIPQPHPLLSDMPLVDLGFYDWAVIVSHHEKKAHLVCAHLKPETKAILDTVKQRWNETRPNGSFYLKSDIKPLMTEEEYHQAFAVIHQALRQGRSYQVNLTQPFISEYSGDTWEIYKRIRKKNPVPFAAYLSGTLANMMSFSPERFVLMDQHQVLTSPIKGTIRRSESADIDQALQDELLRSEKNRAENVMIVDLLRNDLGKIAKPGSVSVTSLCELQSFNSVHHLVSDVEAVVHDDKTMMDVFSACFPGGSITGAPKRESMRIIAENEAYSRGVYCGSIGYFSSHGRFDSNIAIRTITATESHLIFSAGGGIVIDSQCDDEYQECFTKIKAIVSLLQD